jgi:hypothetical protein
MAFTIRVNGNAHSVDVDGDTPLLWVLRDVLGMTGTKFGCGMALCGACTVHIDGGATRSCITPIESAEHQVQKNFPATQPEAEEPKPEQPKPSARVPERDRLNRAKPIWQVHIPKKDLGPGCTQRL